MAEPIRKHGHLVTLLEMAEASPDALFHVEANLREQSNRPIADLDSKDMARLTGELMNDSGAVIQVTDHNHLGKRALIIDTNEIVWLSVAEYSDRGRGRKG